MNITLKQLRVFTAIARTENVSRAATELSLTQSAASMALRELEQQLGVQLFDRAGKRLQLNVEGNRLLPKARQILDEVQQIAGELGHAVRPQLAVGASTTIADCLFPTMATHLYQRHADLDLQLESGNSSNIMALLLAHRIDLGLVEGVCQHPQLASTPWWTDRLVIVASPEHPLVRQSAMAPLPVTALAGSRWILREAGSGTRAIFEHAFRAQLSGFELAAGLKHLPTIRALVAAGDALTCLSGISVSTDIAAGRLAVVHVRDLTLERQFYLLEHKQAYRSAIHGELIDWIMQQAACRGAAACSSPPY